MSSIMGQIEAEHLDSLAREFGKIAEYDFVYTYIIYKYQPLSTKLGQNVCDHKISDDLIMDLIGPELSELLALELENLPYLT